MATAALKNGHDNAAVANGLLKFLNAAWTQFHAVGKLSCLPIRGPDLCEHSHF